VHMSGVISKHFSAQRRPRECPTEETTGCPNIANKFSCKQATL
jgi:hypothetical protein